MLTTIQDRHNAHHDGGLLILEGRVHNGGDAKVQEGQVPFLSTVALSLLHLAAEITYVAHNRLAGGQARCHQGTELHHVTCRELEGIEGGTQDLLWEEVEVTGLGQTRARRVIIGRKVVCGHAVYLAYWER